MPRLIAFASLVPRPWKNGGGITRQIACFPPDSGLEDFDWRLSTASVAQDGAFSPFPGIDRRLYILEGAGLDLGFAAKTERLPLGRHIDFAGEAEVTGRLVDGPVTDFNIMVRRGRRRMVVEEKTVSGSTGFDLPWTTAALFVLGGAISVAGSEARRFDTFLCGGPMQVTVSGAARLLVVGLPAA